MLHIPHMVVVTAPTAAHYYGAKMRRFNSGLGMRHLCLCDRMVVPKQRLSPLDTRNTFGHLTNLTGKHSVLFALSHLAGQYRPEVQIRTPDRGPESSAAGRFKGIGLGP
jgi:hypothetical protein